MFSKRKEKIVSVDSFCQKNTKRISFDWPLAKFVMESKRSSVLFSRNGRREIFLDRYCERRFSSTGLPNKSFFRPDLSVDGIIIKNYALNGGVCHRPEKLIFSKDRSDKIYREIKEKYQTLGDYFSDLFRGRFSGISTVKVWNLSIVGSLIFGMFLMTMIYRYLGQGVLAKHKDTPVTQAFPIVLGDESFKSADDSDAAAQITQQLLQAAQNQEQIKEDDLEKEIRKMVKGYPIEKMIPYIVKKDRITAAFIIGIAKQESDWGKHVPVDENGDDCYNYWGYKGKNRVGSGGHSCFDSPQDAVDTVAKRLEFLVSQEKVNTPGKMVVIWKCGYDCSWDKPQNVKNWIGAVDTYFGKLNTEK